MSKAIRYVRQLDSSGCGIACAAMLTGTTYNVARNVWVKQLAGDESRLNRLGDGLRVFEMCDLLLALGWIKWPTVVHAPCIVSLKSSTGRHYVVITEDGAILDPKAGSKIDDIQCPVCGYYCLGKGGVGCIDKPGMLNRETRRTEGKP